MDNPRDDTTKEQYRSRGVFTIAGVRADPETAGMEVAFAASHAALMTKEREIEDLQDTVQEHEAIISVRDAATDKLVRSFDLRLLDLVNKNRDDPRYRRYFPKEPLLCPAAPPLPLLPPALPDWTTTRTFADLNRTE